MSEAVVDSLPAVRRLIAYDRWANFRTLASLQSVDSLPARARLWLPHIVGAQCTWLARLQGLECTVPIWPEWTLDETGNHMESLYDQWRVYLDCAPPPDLNKPVAYKNSRGEAYSDTPADIVQHILLHSHYHRGQIAAEVRAANGTPAISDFIVALRDPDYTRSITATP